MSTTHRPGEVATAAEEDQAAGTSHASEGDLAITDEVLNEEGQGQGALTATLARLQELLGCVSPPVQEVVARRLSLPPVTVQEVVSFEGDLSPQPRRGTVTRLCGGAACLAPHGLGVIAAARTAAAAGGGEVHTAPCLGACWGAPVAELGGVRRVLLTVDWARELPGERGTKTLGRHRPRLRGVPVAAWGREELNQIRERLGEGVGGRVRPVPGAAVHELLVCNGSACSRDVADRVAEVVSRSLAERGLDRRVRVIRVGCRGEDVGAVTITACPAGWRVRGVDEGRAAELVAALQKDPASAPADAVWPHDSPKCAPGVLRRCGFVDPCSLEEYIASGGFRALERILTDGDGPSWALQALESSGLATRDGQGELLAGRFAAARQAGAAVVLCPCVSSDAHLPADSLLLGGDPFSVIEGVLLAGVLCGASHAIVMPPAGALHLVEQTELAVALARRRGLVGGNLLGSGFALEMRVIPAPRQLVAADEWALRQLVLAGRALKPPSESVAATLPHATMIDPETAARLCGVLELAVAEASGGGRLAAQRLLTVTGRTITPTVLEVSADATLEEVLARLPGRHESAELNVKGVLYGGLTGVFAAGRGTGEGVASRGSLLVLDEAACVVTLLSGVLATLAGEACGACAPGRTGVRTLRDLWGQLAAGEGEAATLAMLREIAAHVAAAARCALGRGAARMVISALAAFPDEVAAHLAGGRCPAGPWAPLVVGS